MSGIGTQSARGACCSLILIIALIAPALAYDELNAVRSIATPVLPDVGYLQEARDPVFGTLVTRITDPGAKMPGGVVCKPAYCTHRYSSSQAWNADQSLLVIVNGCAGLCFLDGQTYVPLFHRSTPDECEWHPTDPRLMICVGGRTIYTWNPRSDMKTIAFVGDGYRDLQFGPYKGNPSRDGARLVVRAATDAGTLVAFAFDIQAKIKFADINLSELPGRNGYCGISPSGLYIFCAQKMPGDIDEGYVFSVNGAQIQHWTDHHRPGHGDMTIDADGSDVYVGISKDNPDKFHIIKRRLIDGKVTDLAPYGEGQHASLRNVNLPGWVFLSYGGYFSEVSRHRDWAPFYQEIVALRIDGSGEVRRIAQTRNPKHDYWSETHASPSPDGSQVIWSSNWGSVGGPVADYVTRLSWPKEQLKESSMRQ
ncbi:MAG: hypothetical protein J0G37_07710 [Afipia sp.]|nr:hypothetical protein [Afipia sp.]